MRIEHFRYAFRRLNGFYLKEHDNAVDKWLKGNAKKYGYKYTRQK